MQLRFRTSRTLLTSGMTLAAPFLMAATLFAQTHTPPAAKAAPIAVAAPAAPVPTDRDVAATQAELIKLLRLSPKLTTVVSHDPSLLSNQDYVAQNNPQLAAFLASHPEVGRNPDFYLFTHLNHEGGEADEALQRAVWPDVFREPQNNGPMDEFVRNLSPLLGFACFLVALVWMIRVLVENRRWGRIFKLQSEVHGKLIEKFTNNQELALYMETEAGKRFLEAAPIPVSFEAGNQRFPNAVARVLMPVQIGVVLVLLGIGMLSLRHASRDMDVPMLVLGTVLVMPGLGFIISAGLTWVLATRLGLMPPPPPPGKFDAPYGSSERQ